MYRYFWWHRVYRQAGQCISLGHFRFIKPAFVVPGRLGRRVMLGGGVPSVEGERGTDVTAPRGLPVHYWSYWLRKVLVRSCATRQTELRLIDYFAQHYSVGTATTLDFSASGNFAGRCPLIKWSKEDTVILLPDCSDPGHIGPKTHAWD